MQQPFPVTILVTGANGQLGNELRELALIMPQYRFLFAGRDTFPIENKKVVEEYFETTKIHFCINCAAYTAVDKAESEVDLAFLINGTAVGDLALICEKYKTKFIHISTDYVYDGSLKEPLKEDGAVSPLNVYGWSKLKGEELALSNNPDSLIIRTSWVYSSYGHNFLKTMMRLMNEKDKLDIVSDQIGSPTYAADLARVIMMFVEKMLQGENFTGIYNYSNYGITNWYQFAQYIKEQTGSNCHLNPVTTSQYHTPALRPSYSVLDTSKIRSSLALDIPFWKDSVRVCIEKIWNKQ